MSLIVPDAGKILMLASILKQTSGFESLLVDLYVNNYTPVASSIFSNFTIASYTGYAQLPLARATWPTPTVSGAVAQSIYGTNPLVFAVSATGSPQTVYGYVVSGATSGTVWWAELISPSRVMQNAGDTIDLTLQLGLQTYP